MLTRSFRVKKLGLTFYSVGQIFIETVLIKHYVAGSSLEKPFNLPNIAPGSQRPCRPFTSSGTAATLHITSHDW